MWFFVDGLIVLVLVEVILKGRPILPSDHVGPIRGTPSFFISPFSSSLTLSDT